MTVTKNLLYPLNESSYDWLPEYVQMGKGYGWCL